MLRVGLLAGSLGLTALAAGLLGGTATATAEQPRVGDPVARWADQVWTTARRGDLERLEAIMSEVPDVGTASDRFEDDLGRLRSFRNEALEAREADRLEALEEMRTEREKGHRVAALRQAVIAQTHSSDLDAAFADGEIMALVDWAEERVPAVERDRDWIEAQELLYLLRTFYDDTSRTTDFARVDAELEMVNRRVGLLARYAPQILHRMRSERAIEIGEEPLDPFNEARAPDWHERLKDVDHRILYRFLPQAAEEHIEGDGWRPLLEGGLDALEALVTTTPLREVFPKLGDAEQVNRFNERLEAWRREIGATNDDDLGSRTLRDMLNDLADLGDKALELEAPLVVREFGDGAMSRLDDYSDIIWPDEQRRFEQQTRGDFVGVGILIRHNDKREIMVVNPLEGTPAYSAGVRPDDVIVSVDGESTAGWSLNDAVDSITGRRNTTVTIGVRREGVDDTVDIDIVRDVIKIASVKGWRKTGVEDDGTPVWDWRIDEAGNIAYIRLTQFTDSSLQDLLKAWREIRESGGEPNGLILDLRHNPGGLLKAAVLISNLFVPRGTIVTGEDKNRRQMWRQSASQHYAALEGVETVVLVNKGSASASEIVAGCLQAYGAAVVVGERTFGKGSVQTIHSAPGAEGRLKLTTQYYRLPSPDGGRTPGRLVHRRPGADVWGVDPDVDVPMTVTQVSEAIELRQDAERLVIEGVNDEDDVPDVEDLLRKGIDPQLQTALLLLQARAMTDPDVRLALDRLAVNEPATP